MGATRARGIARKAAEARKNKIATKTNLDLVHRIHRAWEFARKVTTNARKVRVVKQLELMANPWGKAPFRAIAGSLTKLRFPPRTLKPAATVTPKREDAANAPRTPLPNARPGVPSIILTAPNGEVTIPDVDTVWTKSQVSVETQMTYRKWKSSNFLSPVYPVDAAKERRVNRKLARVRAAKEKQLQACMEKKKRAVLRRDLRRWGRRWSPLVG